MQFKSDKNYKAADYDCAGCRGKKHQCLMVADKITVKHRILGRRDIGKSDVPRLMAEWRGLVNAFTPDLEILRTLDICPIPLINDFSIQAVRLFNATGGPSGISDPEDYYALPAIWIQAATIIQDESYRAQAIADEVAP
ncbi:MAG: hypothetical protein PHW53_04680 [Patescibacteria group bacterium]|nr:hypothetical protein [Patescibacteria group bacterium]